MIKFKSFTYASVWIYATYLLTCPLFASASSKHPRNIVAFYTDTYGELRPNNDPKIARAFQVFERVRDVADRNSKRLPRLVVVNSDGNPWAIALPDGHIVLSRQAISICLKLRDKAEPCLAFVLGHELAHLANDDFWHQEVHGFLSTSPHTKQFASFLQGSRQAEERELAADDKGYVYAAMAGYAVDALLETRGDEQNFFNFWMQQTNARLSAASSKAQARTAVLQQRLRDIQDKLVFFEFGVRLSHFDYCDDAVYFLQEFQQVFPGREVLNNLGYCYLQMARQAMDPARAYLYWMPLQLDGVTRASALVTRGGAPVTSLKQAVTKKAEVLLKQAIDYLEQAADADPAYVPARINLAVAHLYLGQPHQARARIAEARELAPDRLDIQGLEALVVYEQSDTETDLWPAAVKRLTALANRRDASSAEIFNLARLYKVRARHADAHRHWSRLADLADTLPGPIRSIVCREQRVVSKQSCTRAVGTHRAVAPWRWPLTVKGLEQVASQTIARELAGWKKKDIDWVKDHLHGHIYLRPDGGAAVLELDQFVQMQVLNGNGLVAAAELTGYCNTSLRQRRLPQGVLNSCDDWAALVTENQVNELWWIAK